MKVPAKFKEYIWLVNTIRKAGKISLAEINEKWLRTEMSEGIELARSTFNRHKDAIEDIFGIYIECDRRNGYKYYIGNERVLHEDTVQNWMLSTLSVNNVLSESMALNERILLDPVPSDGEYLHQIIDAMKNSVRITIEYKRYVSDKVRTHTFDPYCIKMHKQRWYVLGHFQRPAREGEEPDKRKGLPKGYVEYYGTFSLDRIRSLELTNEKFKLDEDFDAAEFFRECFGVVQGDGTPLQRVVIRAYDTQRYYMRDLPWHSTQREIAQGENYADFEFRLRPTMDFSNHILSRGSLVKVLEPEWLAEEICNMHLDGASLYEEYLEKAESEEKSE